VFLFLLLAGTVIILPSITILHLYIHLMIVLWFILFLSQSTIQVSRLILVQKKRTVFICWHLLIAIIGLITAFISNWGNNGLFTFILFIGVFFFTSNSWFVLMQICERVITKKWATFKIQYISGNIVSSIDFKMVFFTKKLNLLSEIVWRKRTGIIFWVMMISATILEIYCFITFGDGIFKLAALHSTYKTSIPVFVIITVIMTVMHEWGHLIGAKTNGGFGSYKEKIALFSRDAIDIPMFVFTPKQRIKIALMGILWTNLLGFIPVVITVYCYLYYQQFFSTFASIIMLSIGFYAIMSTFLFFTSLWPGGDMNNVLRDLYIVLTGKKGVLGGLFDSEGEINYSLIQRDFIFSREKKYRFSGSTLLKPVGDDSFYFLDEESFSAYLINETACSVIQCMTNTNSWNLDSIILVLNKDYEISEKELPAAINDIEALITFLGKRGYIEESG
ncbi:MAG: PqqD family protein, partial [Candidatus Hodarchaeales archaeon]